MVWTYDAIHGEELSLEFLSYNRNVIDDLSVNYLDV